MNLLHLFIPHPNNNHRSKILHNTSLLILIFAFALVSSFGIIVNKSHPEVLGITYQISDQELLNLVNSERTKNGLSPLTMNTALTNAARQKAAHMFANNYWAHFAPDGTSPWYFIRGQGYNYIYAGENLARGFTTSYGAVKAWMASPTHRANILSAQFKDVGFAISEGRLQGEDTVLIVQMFGAVSNPAIANTKALSPIEITKKETVVAPRVQGAAGSAQVNDNATLSSNKLTVSPIIDLIFGTKAIVFSILSILLIALILDLIIVEKKKIPRVVGNNIDHIILITLFIVFLFLAKLGNII
jgi:hypothetical protein